MTSFSRDIDAAQMPLFLCCSMRQEGQRLDRVLADLLPHMGLRGRRRCIATGAVLLNGMRGTAAVRVREGDRVELLPTTHPQTEDAADPDAYFLGRRGGYCFFYKPVRMHSQRLAGGNGVSLECLLPHMLATAPELRGQKTRPVLLQRLDYGTSGLVTAACDAQAQAAFRAAEKQGRCEKRYVAILEGQLSQPAVVRNALDTARRVRSAVLPQQAQANRWTEFWPLVLWKAVSLPPILSEYGSADGATLAACRIRCGARHQIRVHAGHLGHPLLGDALYGSALERGSSADFFLHHGGISLPQAWCFVPPPWGFLPAQVIKVANQWLEQGHL